MVLPLLAKLHNSKTAWVVLTEAAWAPGKIPDKRSMEGRDEFTVIPVERIEEVLSAAFYQDAAGCFFSH